MTKDQSLIVLVGLPYSNKSNLAKRLSNIFQNSKIISSEDIRNKYFKNQKIINNKNVFDILRKEVNEELLKGFTVIVDACNVKSMYRCELLESLTFNKIQKIAFFIEPKIEECLERNMKCDNSLPKEIILQYFDNLEFPNKEEGFDFSFYYSNDEGKIMNLNTAQN